MWIKNEDNEPDDDLEGENLLAFSGMTDEYLVFGLYTQLKSHKDHFSRMQNRYRALTSTWLLASFAGVGYLLSGHNQVQLPFNILIGVVLLCFCAGIGITFLWLLDVVLYQRLWFATVIELARMEESNDWLPSTNYNIILVRKNVNFRFYQSSFYIGINSIYLFIIGVAAMYYYSFHWISFAIVLPALFLAIYAMAQGMLAYSGERQDIQSIYVPARGANKTDTKSR